MVYEFLYFFCSFIQVKISSFLIFVPWATWFFFVTKIFGIFESLLESHDLKFAPAWSFSTSTLNFETSLMSQICNSVRIQLRQEKIPLHQLYKYIKRCFKCKQRKKILSKQSSTSLMFFQNQNKVLEIIFQPQNVFSLPNLKRVPTQLEMS